LLRSADAIVFDHLVSDAILSHARPEAERIFVGKKGGGFCCPQRDIEGTLLRLALVAAGIPFEVVPGVTSALAAAAYAGIPLTHRAHSSAVVFLTGHEDPAKADSAIHWESYGALNATLCIYMGMKNLEVILRRLQAGGLDPATPAAVIQSATTGEHRQLLSCAGRLALASEHAGFGAPSIVIIGEVARLSDQLGWFAARAEALAS
jgi:uroporphyrinogen III methyltransferase/synthase